MSLTRTRLRAAVRVMRYYNSVPLTGAMPVMSPFRDCANHQFTGGYALRDAAGRRTEFSDVTVSGIKAGGFLPCQDIQQQCDIAPGQGPQG